jgi:hypothetical protein
MPSGNVSLLEAAKCGDDMLKAGLIETIIQESPIVEQLHWQPFEGTALKHMEEGTLPNVQFRNVNEDYDSSWGTDNEHYWGTAILGGEVTVDNYLVRVVGNRQSVEKKQYRKLQKANRMRFDYEFLNGTGSVASKGFKGLKTLITEGFGQSFANSTTAPGLDLDKLDEAFDLFRNQGGPEAILCNYRFRREMTIAGRDTSTGFALIDVGNDMFGRKVTQYNGVPLRILGDGLDSSGNVVPLLPDTEDPGDAGNDTASVYLIKFGEDDVSGLLGLGGSFDVRPFGELEAGPRRMARLEWYPGVAVFNQYSVVRLTGV